MRLYSIDEIQVKSYNMQSTMEPFLGPFPYYVPLLGPKRQLSHFLNLEASLPRVREGRGGRNSLVYGI